MFKNIFQNCFETRKYLLFKVSKRWEISKATDKLIDLIDLNFVVVVVVVGMFNK